MHLSTIFAVVAFAVSDVISQVTVPVPWQVTNLQISNVRHGSGGYWSFSILDYPTPKPQGFNTTCNYNNPGAYYFAIDGPPVNAPCADPSVTFGLFPDGGSRFKFNVTHVWECGTPSKPKNCTEKDTWYFSNDDVRGQQSDAGNNFGQAGNFYRGGLAMYPKRVVPSSTCEFCV